MQSSFIRTTLFALLGSVLVLPAYADNTGVEAALVSRPELSMFLQAMHESGVYNELKQDQGYTVFAPINESFAKVVVADSSCSESAECRAQVAAIVRNHIVPEKAKVDVLAKNDGNVGTLGSRPLHIEKSAQAHGGHKVDGYKIVAMHETQNALVYNLDGTIVTDSEISALSALENGPGADQQQAHEEEKPRANAAFAPMVPARPSLVAPPYR